MDNRITVKDFLLFLLLAVLIIVVLLAMKQYDRQYELIRGLQQQSHDQLAELVKIDDDIKNGGGMRAATQPIETAMQGIDPFAALRKLRSEGKYNQGDWLVQNFPVQVAKITPLLSADAYAAILEARVIEGLAYRDPDTLDYVPLLATSWNIKDNTPAWQGYVDQRKKVPITEQEITRESDCPLANQPKERSAYIQQRLKEGRRPEDIGAEPQCPPATIITFQLRKGVTFSDGSPFSADDVVFTFDFIMNPKIDAPRDRQALERVKSVVKTGDNEVAFNFREPYFDSFELASSLGIMSKAFYGKYTPEQFNDSVGLLIGTGPYRMESPTDWKPTTGNIELIRNERYWGLQPSFDRIVYHQVQQESTELVMYTNGEEDSIALEPQQYKILLQRADVMARSNHFEYPSPIAPYSYIAWNERRRGKPTIFADKRVRQALTMLTDRQGICQNILLSYASPATGPFSPMSKQNDPNLKDWAYDPDRAKALLKQVGYQDRGSGVLSLSDGTQLSFKISYPNKNETTQRIMQYIADTYARAGVHAELDPVDWTIIEQRIKSRDYDAISLAWTGGIEVDIYQMFDSSQMADQADNFMSYSNPQLDAAIRAARSTVDEQKRMPMWQQCQRILHDDQPYTFLIIRKALRFMDKRIQNVKVTKTGLNFVQDWNQPVPWYVPPDQQKYTK